MLKTLILEEDAERLAILRKSRKFFRQKRLQFRLHQLSERSDTLGGGGAVAVSAGRWWSGELGISGSQTAEEYEEVRRGISCSRGRPDKQEPDTSTEVRLFLIGIGVPKSPLAVISTCSVPDLACSVPDLVQQLHFITRPVLLCNDFLKSRGFKVGSCCETTTKKTGHSNSKRSSAKGGRGQKRRRKQKWVFG